MDCLISLYTVPSHPRGMESWKSRPFTITRSPTVMVSVKQLKKRLIYISIYTLKKANFRLGICFYLHQCMNKISISFKVQKLLQLTSYIFTLLECVLYNSNQLQFITIFIQIKISISNESLYQLVHSVKWYGMEPWEVTSELWLLYLVCERKLSFCSNAKHVALINYFEFLKIVPN